MHKFLTLYFTVATSTSLMAQEKLPEFVLQNGHSDAVTSVAFSVDGKILASGSRDQTVKLWEVASGRLLRTLEGHSKWVNAVAFSANGKTIASGSNERDCEGVGSCFWPLATCPGRPFLSCHIGDVLRERRAFGFWQ